MTVAPEVLDRISDAVTAEVMTSNAVRSIDETAALIAEFVAEVATDADRWGCYWKALELWPNDIDDIVAELAADIIFNLRLKGLE